MAEQEVNVRDFVIKNINLEGHCDFYEERAVPWKRLIARDSFDVLLAELQGLFKRERESLEARRKLKKYDDLD